MAEPYSRDEESEYNTSTFRSSIRPEFHFQATEDDEDSEDSQSESTPVVNLPRVSGNIASNFGRDSLKYGRRKRSPVEEGRSGGGEILLIGDETAECSQGKWNRTEIDGLCCSICMDTLTSEGDHHICCLPCGHVYGLSCINQWMTQQSNYSAKCPQCNRKFWLMDVIKLFAPRNAAVDGACESEKRIQYLEQKCAFLEKKNADSSRKESELRKKIAELQHELKQLTEVLVSWDKRVEGTSNSGFMHSNESILLENMASRLDAQKEMHKNMQKAVRKITSMLDADKEMQKAIQEIASMLGELSCD